MSDALTFLRAVSGFSRTEGTSADRPIRLATVDSGYDPASFPGTLPRVTFDGESMVSTRRYAVLSPYWPRPGERVAMLPVGNTYMVAGSVSAPIGDVVPGHRVAYDYGTANSAAAGTTGAVTDTISSVTFKAGRAYRVEIGGGYFGSAASAYAFISVRVGGTAVANVTRVITNAGNVLDGYTQTYIRRTAGTDRTAALTVHLLASTGTVQRYGDANTPRWVAVYDAGFASDIPWAPTV